MRKTAYVSITDEGRDRGKTFQLTEMSADHAERWAIRALQAVARSGVDIGDAVGQGMAGLAVMGIQALARMPFEDVEPLLVEMMECVKIIRDPQHPEVAYVLMPDDIEEVPTRFRLRQEVFRLHVNFSLPGAPSTSTSAEPEASPLPSMSTSPRSSGRSSPRKPPPL